MCTYIKTYLEVVLLQMLTKSEETVKKKNLKRDFLIMKNLTFWYLYFENRSFN